jgi:hypothetical protein
VTTVTAVLPAPLFDCASAVSIEPDHVGRPFVGVEVEAFPVGLGLENMAEQKTFERRDIRGGYCRLNDGWREVVCHWKDLREREVAPR